LFISTLIARIFQVVKAHLAIMDLFLSPLISVLVEKGADLLIERICKLWGLEENRKKLRRQLLAIQEKIDDAEVRGADSRAVQEWMKELDAAAHEAMDVLDDFQYEALRQNAISQHPFILAKAMVNDNFIILFPARITY
jgi:Rx N-terminal domain